MPTTNDLAYLAGIIDGEGCISISKRFNKDRTAYKNFVIKLIITNTDLKLIEWLVKNFGFSSIRRMVSKKYPNSKVCYNCNIQSNYVIDLLKQVYPYLIIKKAKAELIIKKWPEPRAIDLKLRVEVYQDLMKLNNAIKTNRLESIANKGEN